MEIIMYAILAWCLIGLLIAWEGDDDRMGMPLWLYIAVNMLAGPLFIIAGYLVFLEGRKKRRNRISELKNEMNEIDGFIFDLLRDVFSETDEDVFVKCYNEKEIGFYHKDVLLYRLYNDIFKDIFGKEMYESVMKGDVIKASLVFDGDKK